MEYTTLASFILASRLAAYPDGESAGDVQELLAQPLALFPGRDRSLWDALRAAVHLHLEGSAAVAHTASRYIDLFDRGAPVNSLYETEYGLRRSQLKTSELADIAGFYEAFGFKLSDEEGSREMCDHIAVECEFYALLAAKEQYQKEAGDSEGEAIIRDARRKFLQDHLGRYPKAIAERPLVQQDPLYGVVFQWIHELVGAECDALGVTPVPVDYRDTLDLNEPLGCGSSEAIVSTIGGGAKARPVQ